MATVLEQEQADVLPLALDLRLADVSPGDDPGLREAVPRSALSAVRMVAGASASVPSWHAGSVTGAEHCDRGWTRAVVVRALTWGASAGAVCGAGLVLLIFALGAWAFGSGLDAGTVLTGAVVGLLVGAVLGVVSLGVAAAVLVAADRRGQRGHRVVRLSAAAAAAVVAAVAVRLLLATTMGALVAGGAAVLVGLAALVVALVVVQRLVALKP